MSASRGDKLWFWLISFCVFGLLVFLLHSILLPFVAGMAIAYFLDPMVNRLQRLGLSRTVVTVIITLAFFLLLVVLGLVLVPLIEDQVVGFAQRVPDYVHKLMLRAQPIWASAKKYLSADDLDQLRSAGGEYAGTVATWVGGFFSRLLTGSLVVFNVVSLIFVTPIVTFYMLRDWNGLTRRVDTWLPLAHAQTIREQLHEMDTILAGFVRGQALVCLSLGSFYALGLTAVGLDLGLVVGFASGMASFIPYLGTVSGFIIGISLALAQSPDWNLPLMVAGVFLVGNLLENYVLSPKLVGEKIGLHPVWVIFALLAGGSLFGFLGILLALPVTAMIGVLARFGLKRYMASSFYRGEIIEGKQRIEGKVIVESKEK